MISRATARPTSPARSAQHDRTAVAAAVFAATGGNVKPFRARANKGQAPRESRRATAAAPPGATGRRNARDAARARPPRVPFEGGGGRQYEPPPKFFVRSW
jgi:hypothetical protein